jgi:uncharacterized membrane protein
VQAHKRNIEAALAFLALGVAYGLVSTSFTIGPPFLILGLAIAGSIAMAVLHWRGRPRARAMIAVSLMVLITAAVAVSAGLLLAALLQQRFGAGDLLVSAALLWLSNLLVFSLWYWELDGGGPHNRHPGPHVSSDFLFPQMEAGSERATNWCPEYLDYLFLAFNTSTAFSPTDTMVLARRAKVLMMLQSIISLITIAVLAARAINTL